MHKWFAHIKFSLNVSPTFGLVCRDFVFFFFFFFFFFFASPLLVVMSAGLMTVLLLLLLLLRRSKVTQPFREQLSTLKNSPNRNRKKYGNHPWNITTARDIDRIAFNVHFSWWFQLSIPLLSLSPSSLVLNSLTNSNKSKLSIMKTIIPDTHGPQIKRHALSSPPPFKNLKRLETPHFPLDPLKCLHSPPIFGSWCRLVFRIGGRARERAIYLGTEFAKYSLSHHENHSIFDGVFKFGLFVNIFVLLKQFGECLFLQMTTAPLSSSFSLSPLLLLPLGCLPSAEMTPPSLSLLKRWEKRESPSGAERDFENATE